MNTKPPKPARIAVARDDHCFCCGSENPDGLKLDIIYPEPGVAEATLVIPDRFTGWRRMTHGGFISMVLDEIMAHAVISSGAHAVTAELDVRFRSAVEVGARVRVVAGLDRTRGRLFVVSGSMYRDGAEVARSTGKFFAAAPPDGEGA